MDLDFFNPWNRKEPENLTVILEKLQNNLIFFAHHIRRIRPRARTNIKLYRKRTDEFIDKIDQMKKNISVLRQNIESFAKKDVKIFVSFFSEFEEQVRNLMVSVENLLNTTRAFRDETGAIVKRKNLTGKLIFDDNHYDKLKEKVEDIEEFSKKIADNPTKLMSK